MHPLSYITVSRRCFSGHLPETLREWFLQMTSEGKKSPDNLYDYFVRIENVYLTVAHNISNLKTIFF